MHYLIIAVFKTAYDKCLTCGEQNEKENVFNQLIFQRFYKQAQFQELNHE